uniref:Uncharacterized protein n=1 Tax=Oryzias latipes TaxID=8090 RepID=A0A3P9LCV6_ORYLA
EKSQNHTGSVTPRYDGAQRPAVELRRGRRCEDPLTDGGARLSCRLIRHHGVERFGGPRRLDSFIWRPSLLKDFESAIVILDRLMLSCILRSKCSHWMVRDGKGL